MTFQTKEQMVRITTVELEGRVDAFNAPELRQQVGEIIDQGITRIVFDLSKVSFFDSAAMAVLVSTLKRTRSENGDVKLVWPEAETGQRIIKLTKFDRVFDMHTSALAAQQQFGV